MHDYLVYRRDPLLGPLFWNIDRYFTKYRSEASLLTKREAEKIQRSEQTHYATPLQVIHHLTEIAL